jgi:hypothetical protein
MLSIKTTCEGLSRKYTGSLLAFEGRQRIGSFTSRLIFNTFFKGSLVEIEPSQHGLSLATNFPNLKVLKGIATDRALN